MDSELRNKLYAMLEYWLIANKMRDEFFSIFSTLAEQSESSSIKDYRTPSRSIIMYMRLWYSSLYVVLEGYNDLHGHLKSDKVDYLCGNKEAVDALRKFRNSTFHYQKSWTHEKFMDFFRSGDRASWIRNLHKELGITVIQKNMEFTKYKNELEETMEKLTK